MQFRSLFSKIFGNQKEYKDVTALKLLNGYTNMYTPFSGNAYDDATVRDCHALSKGAPIGSGNGNLG